LYTSEDSAVSCTLATAATDSDSEFCAVFESGSGTNGGMSSLGASASGTACVSEAESIFGAVSAGCAGAGSRTCGIGSVVFGGIVAAGISALATESLVAVPQ
jgi:hypothetical protein